MKFQNSLGGLRPLITRLILITCVCISGLFWLQSHADQDFKVAIDDASPPTVQLSFDASEDELDRRWRGVIDGYLEILVGMGLEPE